MCLPRRGKDVDGRPSLTYHRRVHAARSVAAIAFALSTACEGPAPPAPPSAGKPAIALPDDDLGRKLAQEAATLAVDHALDVEAFRDRLAVGATRDFLAVLVAEHCYRIIGVGDANVADLELVLFDPHGVQVRRDLDRAPLAVLGIDAELCPPEPGAYRLQARASEGSGEILVGVYRTAR